MCLTNEPLSIADLCCVEAYSWRASDSCDHELSHASAKDAPGPSIMIQLPQSGPDIMHSTWERNDIDIMT